MRSGHPPVRGLAALGLVSLPVALGLAVTLGPRAQLAAAALAAALVVAAVPSLRDAVSRREALPLVLSAPAAVSVYPALAVPLTIVVLVGALVLPGPRRPLRARDRVALLLATAALLLPLAPALASRSAPLHVAGDALQFLGFFLAALVARTQGVGLLTRPSLWGLWLATVAVSIANALGRVDFLAAADSDIRRNINFVAPVLLLWALTDLLWNGVTRRGLLWVTTGAFLLLLGFTRGMWAGAAVGLAVVAVLYLGGSDARLAKSRRLAATLTLTFAVVVALPTVAPELSDIAADKAVSLLEREADYTYRQRDFESRAVLDQLDGLVWGEGWGATYVMPAGGNVPAGEVHYVHNQYVAQLLRTGVVGCALSAAALLALLRVRRGGPGSAVAAGTLAYVVVTGWTSPSLFTYPTNLLAGLAVGAAATGDATWWHGPRPMPSPRSTYRPVPARPARPSPAPAGSPHFSPRTPTTTPELP